MNNDEGSPDIPWLGAQTMIGTALVIWCFLPSSLTVCIVSILQIE